VAKLTRYALEPMGEPRGIDYDYAAVTAPTSQEEIGFQALRCGTALLVAFCDPPSWGATFTDRKTKRLARRGAGDLFERFSSEQGQAAISWLTQSYGRVTAEARRRAAAEEPDPGRAAMYEATADQDDWLAAIVGERWPVDNEPAKEWADSIGHPPDLHESESHVLNQRARVDASIEPISVVLWPEARDLHAVFLDWTGGPTIDIGPGVTSDWHQVAPQWANLIGPDRRSYMEVVESAEAPGAG
jgi:hypothetical protein